MMTKGIGHRAKGLGQDGLSLVEMLIVIAIAGILMAIATIQFGQWTRKYNIEREIKELYSDLMNARAMAARRNRTHFITLTANQYTIVDDRNENDRLDATDCLAGNDCQLLQRNSQYVISWNDRNQFDNDRNQFDFDRRGIATNKTICIFSNVSPSYDCIVISDTRINMGRIQNQGGGCNADNCQQR